jgi:hypothetical protein
MSLHNDGAKSGPRPMLLPHPPELKAGTKRKHQPEEDLQKKNESEPHPKKRSRPLPNQHPTSSKINSVASPQSTNNNSAIDGSESRPGRWVERRRCGPNAMSGPNRSYVSSVWVPDAVSELKEPVKVTSGPSSVADSEQPVEPSQREDTPTNTLQTAVERPRRKGMPAISLETTMKPLEREDVPAATLESAMEVQERLQRNINRWDQSILSLGRAREDARTRRQMALVQEQIDNLIAMREDTQRELDEVQAAGRKV